MECVRYYDPSAGRWLTQDPVGFSAGDANFFRYVHNGPTLSTDPSGLEIHTATAELAPESWGMDFSSGGHGASEQLEPGDPAYTWDAFFEGWGHMLTSWLRWLPGRVGDIHKWRESLYGPDVPNHIGEPAYNAGQVVGAIHDGAMIVSLIWAGWGALAAAGLGAGGAAGAGGIGVGLSGSGELTLVISGAAIAEEAIAAGAAGALAAEIVIIASSALNPPGGSGGGSSGASNTYPTDVHHNLPQQFEQFFEDAGLDIEEFTEPMPADAHRLPPDGLHSGPDNWNELWAQFIHDYPEAGADQILEFLDEIRAMKGLAPW